MVNSSEAKLTFVIQATLKLGYRMKIGWGCVALKIVSDTKIFHEDRNILLISTGELLV